MRKEYFLGWIAAASLLLLPHSFAQVVDVGEPQVVDPNPEPAVARRVVATPRVSVVSHPDDVAVKSENALGRCRVVGAAYNFPRPPCRMLVRPGTHVFVQLGNHIEGVWYDGACGWLGASIRLDVFDDETNRWKPVGHKFRAAKACGPNWGSVNNMGVRFVTGDSGSYLLRAQVVSFALPLRSDLSVDRHLYRCSDIETDYIFTKVRVVEFPTDVDRDWEVKEPQIDDEPVEFVAM